MFLVYFGIYTFILAILWGFFMIAKLHSYKFKTFSKNIEKVTMVLAIFLISLSILGYVLLFFIDTSETTFQITPTKKVEDTYY